MVPTGQYLVLLDKAGNVPHYFSNTTYYRQACLGIDRRMNTVTIDFLDFEYITP